ncbi:ABC transporter permease [Metasolibacillus meyeri]|uniref:ABC transporter permease n=1 Tax=Metasolibacillus meyeri TaxID=1071052 RepID=A0AAW9NS56_9BACL|nr:FtsX-like permease family protein [Metasolibacillus meyeri]MEC1180592.1 ABC transporter permease [Metasolibacillus meyeri]
MFNLRAIALKLYRAASKQIAMSVMIIALSICLIMTMAMYIWNGKAQLQADIYRLFGEAEIYVGYNPEQNKWLTAEQFSAIEEIEEVNDVSAIHLTHTNVEGVRTFVYTIGSHNDALVKSRYHYEQNIGASDVVISQKLAQLFDKEVGDTLLIEFQPYTIVEVLTPLPGASDIEVVILAHATAQAISTYPIEGEGMFALVDLDKKAPVKEIATQLLTLDEELRIDIVNEYDYVKANFQALMIFIIVLSFFVLLITIVLLMSAFQLVFVKLKEQLMVLRALGASKKQIGKIVQIQLLTILAVGVVSGSLFSFVIIKFALPTLVEKMHLPPAKTDFPILLALIIIAVFSALIFIAIQWQMRKSMKLLPLQIAVENEETAFRMTKVKLFIIGVLAFFAVLSFLGAAAQKDNDAQQASAILLGTLLTTLLVLLLVPYVFSWLLKFALQPIRMLFGREAYLASQQLMPQIRKNMPIILSMIGLMMILIFGTTLFKTIQANDENYLNYLFEAPVVVKNDLQDPTFTYQVVEEIRALPSVKDALLKGGGSGLHLFKNEDWHLSAVEATDLQRLLGQETEHDMRNSAVVTEDYAKKHALHIGDRLPVGDWRMDSWHIEELQVEPIEIIDIVPDEERGIEVYVDWSSEVVAQDPRLMVKEILIETDHIEQTLQEISFLYERWPALVTLDYDSFVQENEDMHYQRWSLFIGVLIVIFIGTCLGVIQVLMHMIHRKRMDYAIQRLIGLSPNGLVKLILSQVLAFILYGLAVGIILGVTFTKLLALVDNSKLVFNYSLLLTSSIVFVVLVMLTFTVQGFWISRKVLSQELTE